MVKRSDEKRKQKVIIIEKFNDYKNFFNEFFNYLQNITKAGEIFIQDDNFVYWASKYNLKL
jgi:hypothetical protein